MREDSLFLVQCSMFKVRKMKINNFKHIANICKTLNLKQK